MKNGKQNLRCGDLVIGNSFSTHGFFGIVVGFRPAIGEFDVIGAIRPMFGNVGNGDVRNIHSEYIDIINTTEMLSEATRSIMNKALEDISVMKTAFLTRYADKA